MSHKKQLCASLALCSLILCIAMGTSSCADSGSTAPTTNVTSSTSSTSNGTINCNNVQYKEACQEISRRYAYLNDANKYGYFYGFVQGVDHPMVEYVVQGGVFPTSDLVSNPNYQEACNSSGNGACAVVLDKQQPDGTYSTNGSSEFGFLADGNYFEWDGPYAYAQQPLSFKGQTVVGCKTGVPGC